MTITLDSVRSDVAELIDKGASESDIDKYIIASGFSPSQLSSGNGANRDLKGFLKDAKEGKITSPKIKDTISALKKADPRNFEKKDLGKLVTAAQFLIPGGIAAKSASTALKVAAPVVVETAGEFAKGLLEGDSLEEAKRKSERALGISAVFSLANFGAGKVLQAGVSKAFNKGVEKTVKAKPQLVRSSMDIDEAAEKSFEAIKKLRSDQGSIVGKAKKAAREANKEVNIDEVLDFADNVKKDIRFVVPKGEKAVTKDLAGQRAFRVIEEELTDPVKPTFRNIESALDNIDSSPTFQSIYNKNSSPDKFLSNGEAAALRVRGKLNEILSKSTENAAKESDLKIAKKGFADIVSTLNDATIKRGMKSRDSLASVIKSSMSKGRLESFEQLQKIDSLLPKQDKFLDDAISGVINENLGNIGNLFSTKGARGIAEKVSKVAVSPVIQTAARREVIEGAPVTRASLNQVVYGGGQ